MKTKVMFYAGAIAASLLATYINDVVNTSKWKMASEAKNK